MNSENEEQVKTQECLELKNIQYKTMLLSGAPLKETKSSNDMSNLDKFLEDEKTNNKSEPWCKLDKTIKTKKMLDFVEVYKNENSLDQEEEKILIAFLKDCLDRKKLQKVKEVNYDKTNGKITEIPALSYTKASKHFTLKNLEKRVSTLKSLAPKKAQGTIKNKGLIIKNETNKEKETDVSSDEDN